MECNSNIFTSCLKRQQNGSKDEKKPPQSHTHAEMQKYTNAPAHENGESEELKTTSAAAATEDTNFNVQCKMI